MPRLSPSSPQASPAGPATLWRVEMLKGERWVLLRRGLLRQPVCYASYEEALRAAVHAWRRHDRPARPLPLA